MAQGAIEYMFLDDPDARRLLRTLTLLVIPLYDPDGAALTSYHRITSGYGPGRSAEAEHYARFLIDWFRRGHRIDLTICLHNVESREAPHISCGSMPKSSKRHQNLMNQFHSLVHAQMESVGFQSNPKCWGPNFYDYRLCGHLYFQYAIPWVLYEVNTQAPKQHLSLAQSRIMGAVLLNTSRKFLYSDEFRPFRKEMQDHREEWQRRWLYFSHIFPLDNSRLRFCSVARRVWDLGDPEDLRHAPHYATYWKLLNEKYPYLVRKDVLPYTSPNKD